MNKKITQTLTVFTFFLLSLGSIAKPIPADQLFKAFDTRSATLSPDGSYLATFRIEEDRNLIDFTFTDSMIQHEIISFSL